MSVRVIGFKTEYLPVDHPSRVKARKAGKAEKESRIWVELAPAGDGFATQRTWHLIDHIRPPEGKPSNQRQADTHVAMRARWDVVEPALEAYLNDQEIPEDGTPLAAWSGLSPEMAGYLRSNMGIRTLEQLAELSPDHAAKLPFPNARRIPETAKKYLDGANSAAKDAELADMKAQLEAMKVAMDESKPKRGPGRPKKEAEAA